MSCINIISVKAVYEVGSRSGTSIIMEKMRYMEAKMASSDVTWICRQRSLLVILRRLRKRRKRKVEVCSHVVDDAVRRLRGPLGRTSVLLGRLIKVVGRW